MKTLRSTAIMLLLIAPSASAADDRAVCLLKQATFDELVKAKTDACVANLSSYRTCAQTASDRESDNTGKGALLGVGLAFLTGGVSLLVAGAAGAVAGNVASDNIKTICGAEPDCATQTISADVEKIVGTRPVDCPKK